MSDTINEKDLEKEKLIKERDEHKESAAKLREKLDKKEEEKKMSAVEAIRKATGYKEDSKSELKGEFGDLATKLAHSAGLGQEFADKLTKDVQALNEQRAKASRVNSVHEYLNNEAGEGFKKYLHSAPESEIAELADRIQKGDVSVSELKTFEKARNIWKKDTKEPTKVDISEKENITVEHAKKELLKMVGDLRSPLHTVHHAEHNNYKRKAEKYKSIIRKSGDNQ